MKGTRRRRRTILITALALIAGLGATVPAHADDPAYPFRDPDLPVSKRAPDIMVPTSPVKLSPDLGDTCCIR